MKEVLKLKAIYCDKYTEKPLELYCFECKKVICMVCYVELHHSHKCSHLKEVAREFQEQMTCDIKNMIDTVKSCRRLIKERKDYYDEFKRH